MKICNTKKKVQLPLPSLFSHTFAVQLNKLPESDGILPVTHLAEAAGSPNSSAFFSLSFPPFSHITLDLH
jgi:hypothetical protein